MKNNYRKIYEDATGHKIPVRFHVHHIDMNHYNNDILNLVSIPRSLHRRYHYYVSCYLSNIQRFNQEKFISNFKFLEEEEKSFLQFEKVYKNILECKKEISKYILERDYNMAVKSGFDIKSFCGIKII